ncbi:MULTISPECIES: hypothetical protein [unclassified Paenibacillus]|uniref:hypothetical protein n=1 Tax=unclassified Paenibacillus TaxID=185978 RepID=UPI00363BF467
MKPRIQWQIMFAVCSGKHVQMVSVVVLFARAIPTRVAIWLRISAWMVAFRKAAGMAITSWFAVGPGGRFDRSAVASHIESGCVPQQA